MLGAIKLKRLPPQGAPGKQERGCKREPIGQGDEGVDATELQGDRKPGRSPGERAHRNRRDIKKSGLRRHALRIHF